MKTKLVFLLGGLVAMGIAGAVRAQSDSVSSVRRYTDELNGFSLVPPAEASVEPVTDPDKLVRWTRKDRSGRLLWSLSVQSLEPADPSADLEEIVGEIRSRLEAGRAVNVKQQSTQIDGRDAMELSARVASPPSEGGQGDGPGETHLRQLWVRNAPGQVLGFQLVSRADGRTEAVWRDVVASIRLHDPAEALAKLQAATDAAAEWLRERMTPEAILAVLDDEPRWFLVYRHEKIVGWFVLHAVEKTRDGLGGFEVRTWSMLELPESPVRMVRQWYFVDRTFDLEQWRSYVQVGSGSEGTVSIIDGLRQGGLLVATTRAGGMQNTMQKHLSQVVREIYLPKALGLLLTRLVPLEDASYTFAEYSPTDNDFAMRTFTLHGRETIDLPAGRIACMRATDRPDRHAEPTRLWIDSQNHVRRVHSPDGLQTRSAMRQEVLARYPNAENLITELNRAERQAQR